MDHICTDSSFYAGTGKSKTDLQFKRWCPYCDKVVLWQHSSPYTDDQKCLTCGFEIEIGDPRGLYPRGLNPMTGKLIKSED
ncbi:MAG: hypothetical protein U9O94_08325 [Nanoarchaeota archaeon]|nr:hypothetical protein [Nanoarchaeota archaeon]